MLKVCIEIISNGKYIWTYIPNENLWEEISNFVGDKDWECTIITGLVKDRKTEFTNNSFHKCDLNEFNQMLLQLNNFQYTIENLATLNLFLEDRHYNCDEVINMYEESNFRVYHNVDNMSDVAMEYLENTTEWYSEFEEQRLLSYFDFLSYGEEVLLSSGTWLKDKRNKIIIEVF